MIDCVVVGGGPAGLAASVASGSMGCCTSCSKPAMPGRHGRPSGGTRFASTPQAGPTGCWAISPAMRTSLAGKSSTAWPSWQPCTDPNGSPCHDRRPTGTGFTCARQTRRSGRGPWSSRPVTRTFRGHYLCCHPARPDRPVALRGIPQARALPEGVVLVVGSGQSGAQISEDLLVGGTAGAARDQPGRPGPRAAPRLRQLRAASCRRVLRTHAGRSLGSGDDASHQPILAPGGKPLSLQTLARAGATLTGRMVAVDDRRVMFDDSTELNVAAGEAFASRPRNVGRADRPHRPDTRRPGPPNTTIAIGPSR